MNNLTNPLKAAFMPWTTIENHLIHRDMVKRGFRQENLAQKAGHFLGKRFIALPMAVSYALGALTCSAGAIGKSAVCGLRLLTTPSEERTTKSDLAKSADFAKRATLLASAAHFALIAPATSHRLLRHLGVVRTPTLDAYENPPPNLIRWIEKRQESGKPISEVDLAIIRRERIE